MNDDLVITIGVFVSLVFLFSVKGFSIWTVLKGVIAATLLLYFTPVFFILLFIYLAVRWVQDQNKMVPSGGSVSFNHEFFGDNRFSGWDLAHGNSHQPISSQMAYIPQGMRDAAREAVRIDPYNYYSNGSIVVETNVFMENGRPVIYDDIVTPDQVVRRAETGMWNEPQDYKRHISHIQGGRGMVEGDGMVRLPAPAGLSAQFLSAFNGPKITRVKRK